MANFNYAFFQESDLDKVTEVGGSTVSPAVAVLSYPGVNNNFWIEQDENNVNDLCTSLDETEAESYQVVFKRSDNTTYSANANKFGGGHPPTR